MQLKYYLEQLSPSTLKKILEENQIESKDSDPNDLVTRLEEGLLTIPNINKMYQIMTTEEKEVLQYLIFQFPNQMLTHRKLDRMNGNLTRDQFEYGLVKLRRKGIIYTLRKSWGEMGYIIPENLYLQWHHYFFKKVMTDIEEMDELSFDGQINIKGDLEEDIFRLLTYIQQNDVPITQKGTIHKRHIAKISEQLFLNEEHLINFPMVNENLYYEYPKNISLILKFVFLLELVENIDSFTTTNKFIKWNSLEYSERRGILETFIRVSYRSTDVMFHHILYFLFHLPIDKWYSFNDIVIGISKEFKRPIGDEIVKRAEEEILKPLLAFGWVDIVKDDQLKIYIKWKPKEVKEILQLYVQANFEVLVPQSFPYHLRSKVERFAELKQIDQMNKYLITKESILHALEKGETISNIIDFIETYSVIPISENVRKSLQDWAKHYGTISFMDIRVMKVNTVEIANKMKDESIFKEWIIGEISPTHLIIKRDNFNEFLEKLHQFGYQPKKEIWVDETKEDHTDDVEEGFEFTRNKGYRIENVFPSITANWI